MNKTYKVLKPISFGGRREKGEVIEMSEAEAENIGFDYLEEVTPAQADVAEGEVETKPTRKSKKAKVDEEASEEK